MFSSGNVIQEEKYTHDTNIHLTTHRLNEIQVGSPAIWSFQASRADHFHFEKNVNSARYPGSRNLSNKHDPVATPMKSADFQCQCIEHRIRHGGG